MKKELTRKKADSILPRRLSLWVMVCSLLMACGLVVAKTAEQEIHFEFYTVLPKMRVPVPDADKPAAQIRTVSLNPPKVDTPYKVIKPEDIFDAGRLQHAFKHQLMRVSKP